MKTLHDGDRITLLPEWQYEELVKQFKDGKSTHNLSKEYGIGLIQVEAHIRFALTEKVRP